MTKKIWIEILTPKQVMFFGRLLEKCRERGYETVVTSRDYSEVNKVRDRYGIDAEVVGEHGGSTLSGKLSAGLERAEKLQEIVESEQPDVAVYLSSPDAARVSFGLGIESISVNDIPEAEAQSKLTVPISSRVACPKCIPKKVFTEYGISEDRVVQYDALDPIAWLKDFKPDEKILNELDIDSEKPLITFRTMETKASYLKEEKKVNFLVPIIKEISEKIDAQIVVLSRYNQEEEIKKELSDDITVTNYVSQPQSLLYYSDVFVGAGGTMSLEAGLLGTPTLSCRPIDTYYERHAKKEGLIEHVEKGNETEKIIHMLEKNGKYKKELRKTAERLKKEMESPIDVLMETIEELV
ncbi:MAG: DUF354 domain-containing protein [Candidatus Undinarchaeales archaeon]